MKAFHSAIQRIIDSTMNEKSALVIVAIQNNKRLSGIRLEFL